MSNDRKQKLIDLGPEILADALLDLATHSDETNDLIERMTASRQENVQRFKKKLAGIKRRKRYIDWRGVSGFARELEMLLEDLDSGVDDPLSGVELVATFYEADTAIFEMCDDSSGTIGDIFRHNARDLFVAYSVRCEDKEKIADLVLKVNQEDDYGIRDTLVDCAGECLPEQVIRTMIALLQKQADDATEDFEKRRNFRSIESLARQINDAKLFEKTRIASWGKLSTAALIDIARVYLDSGDAETAESWLNRIPKGETYGAYDRGKLLEAIYRKNDNLEKLTDLLYQKFRSYHSTDTLQVLLDVVGHDKRDDVVDAEVEHILKAETLDTSDAEFLIAVGKVGAAEKLLLDRASQLDGGQYIVLPKLADTMVSENRNLIATLIYRSLLMSILERGYIKAYPYGVGYLKKLDKLSVSIVDWQSFEHHEGFKAEIIETHGRKTSFWSKYRLNVHKLHTNAV